MKFTPYRRAFLVLLILLAMFAAVSLWSTQPKGWQDILGEEPPASLSVSWESFDLESGDALSATSLELTREEDGGTLDRLLALFQGGRYRGSLFNFMGRRGYSREGVGGILSFSGSTEGGQALRFDLLDNDQLALYRGESLLLFAADSGLYQSAVQILEAALPK